MHPTRGQHNPHSIRWTIYVRLGYVKEGSTICTWLGRPYVRLDMVAKVVLTFLVHAVIGRTIHVDYRDPIRVR